MSTTVVVIDHQPLTRLGVTQLIQESAGLEVVLSAATAYELQQNDHVDIGLLVYDFDRKQGNGLSELEVLRSKYPEARVLIISDENDKGAIHQMLELGVQGFLTKHCSEEEIKNAIKAIIRGEKFFCNKILDLILEKHYTPATDNCEPTSLTERELEIVSLIAAGRRTRQIATELNLSEHTIYTHRKNIMRKLQVNSAQELIVHAMQTGLVQ